MDYSEEYIKMEMECEPKKSFRRGLPCRKQTGILVILGTVYMTVFMVMTFVIYSHQERNFSMLQSWMNSHTSDLTSVKSDFQITGGDLEKKVAELQTLVSSLSSHMNTSGPSNPMTRDLLTPGCTEPDWIPFRNSCYLFSDNTMNWTEAKDYCEEKGAMLLKIEDGSEKEWQFVTNFAKPHDYWIGLTDESTGQWRWTDDTPYTINKEHWAPGQPDDWNEHGLGEEGEDCGQITFNGMLNDVHCSTKMKQWVPGQPDNWTGHGLGEEGEDYRCSRQSGILAILGVCMIIFMAMTFVIFGNQDQKQTETKKLLDSLSSSVTFLQSDQQNKQRNFVKKQDQKQTETERSLDSLKSSVQSDQQNKQRDLESLKSSLNDLKRSVSDLASSVASLSSQQQTSEERVMNALKELTSNMSAKKADVSVPNCKSGWITYESSCFFFSNNKVNWSEARDYCKEQGALLLKIQDNDKEWAFLNAQTTNTFFWVGLTDQTTGNWRWADETPYVMNKKRWNPGQPDDWKEHGLGEEGEDCGQIGYNGKLNDNQCSVKMRFICRVQF
ncbi:C-type lectin domain family 10 member A-like protein [Labeo rohita]|uniref:C-type lectin domain family 10 member A-like protein n=1 Tax=Labeo rohita TaxID=84645 RepID=A0A498NKX4_LABRO|nr:C-type lectin domain family 10 member A-like protein [Labeo rohita]